MRCAFCESSMAIRPTIENVEGETGGMWRQDKFECASCGGAIVHDVFLKIGSTRESWRIEKLPARATPRTTLHCPACDALLVSAWPPDARPEPSTSFAADRPARAERQTDHACVGCDARYVLDEQVQTTWSKAEDGLPIASPLPYLRSR